MTDSLLDAVVSLRSALYDFDRQAPFSFPDPEERLKPLAAAVQRIGHEEPIRLRDCPKEYSEQWHDFIAGRRTDLEPRAVRFLCWEPEVGTDPRFHGHIGRAKVTLSVRAMQGLVASVHQRWSKELMEGPVGTSLRGLLRSYSGANLRLQKWRPNLPLVAGGKGPTIFGDRLMSDVSAISVKADEWGFVEDSGYMRRAVAMAAANSRKQIAAGSPLTKFLTEHILPWKSWDEGDLKSEFSDCVSSPQATQYEELREGLKRFGLDHFGDPRLPANQGRWTGVRRQAQDEFLRWLSREDIVFFFEHVLPRGSDPHGRKDFWLKYVGRVRRSRPLLSPEDAYRLRSLERKGSQKIGHYGSIEGTTSAFLLDFGEVLIIEFSVVGNACYVYDRAGADKLGTNTNFWNPTPFSVFTLKQKRATIGHVTHHPIVWREKMSMLLAQYGIRPGV